MRMKKLMILAVAAIALAACSRTFEHHAVEGTPIGFGTWTETLTKARATASNNTAFQNGDKFNIYGYKTKGNPAANTVVFNGDEVSATVSGSDVTWDYTQHRFWDPAATSYTFYAVLPSNLLNTASTATTDPNYNNAYANNGTFASNAITFDNPTAFNNDILVATPLTVANATYSAANYKVPLVFNHIASCVDLKLKKDAGLGNAVVKITSLSLVNIHNAGHFSITYPTDVPVAAWNEESTPGYLGTETSGNYVYNVTLPDGGATAAGSTTYNDSNVGTTTGNAGEVFSGYVFMPQDILTTGTQQQIKFTYTLAVGNEAPIEFADQVINICDFLTSDKNIEADAYSSTEQNLRITRWAPKTHYTYTITIGAGAVIAFTASVDNWAAPGTGYQYLVN